jgi:hypothetical protein
MDPLYVNYLGLRPIFKVVNAGAVNKSWQKPWNSHLKDLLCEKYVTELGDHSHKWGMKMVLYLYHVIQFGEELTKLVFRKENVHTHLQCDFMDVKIS